MQFIINNLEPLITALKMAIHTEEKRLLIAVDGRSGCGKSTLAKGIAQALNATIVESDDFYSGLSNNDWSGVTAQEKVAKCIDWQRLRSEALYPLLAGNAAVYHPYDFKSGEKLAKHSVRCKAAKVIILDGAYSARPELADLIAVKILVESPDAVRRERLLAREGSLFMEEWHRIWDEAEELYFTKICPASWFDHRVQTL